MTTIILDNRTTEINQFAFYDCFKLKEVNLSYCISLTSIGYMAFGYCPELTEVELDNCTSLTSIGSYAFSGCSNLTSITFLNTTGWYCTESEFRPGTPMDMSDPEQNADWLTSTYVNYYFKFKRNA